MSMPKNWKPKFEDAEPRCPNCAALEAERDALKEKQVNYLATLEIEADKIIELVSANSDLTKRLKEAEGLLKAIQDNRGLCYIPTRDCPDSLYDWDDYVRAFLTPADKEAQDE